MLSAIMSSPEFAEVAFLIGLILFVTATVVAVARTTASQYFDLMIAAGLAFVALGFLAL